MIEVVGDPPNYYRLSCPIGISLSNITLGRSSGQKKKKKKKKKKQSEKS